MTGTPGMLISRFELNYRKMVLKLILQMKRGLYDAV